MTVNLSAYKVALDELSSSTKFDALVQAVENGFNNLGDATYGAFAPGLIFDPAKLKQNAAGVGQALVWNGTAWAPATIAGPVAYKKITQKDVVNTAAKTDLLNAEITIGAGVMSSTGRLEFRAVGDYLNNSGANQTFTLELKLGAQVLWDSGASDSWAASANRHSWMVHVWLQAKAATNAQSGGGMFYLGDRATATTGQGHVSDLAVGANRHGMAAIDFVNATVDMTAAQALTFSVTHSAANASLSMRLDEARVEVFG